MNDTSPGSRWREERTTFQRVYDVIVGMQSPCTAGEIAKRADCSETGARESVEQLVEMGVAKRRDGRPATYRRNDAYLTWKRVERLAREHRPAELRERVDSLLEEDEAFQERYGVPEPEAVTSGDVETEDHDALHDHWEGLSEWRTVRRDIRVLRRAVQRAETRLDGEARA